MNSYSIYKYYHGYFGPEINDGEVNINEDIFYTLKEITSKFIELFPTLNSYTICKDNLVVLLTNMSGEEADKIFQILNSDLFVELYSIVSRDFKTKLKQYLYLYLDIYDKFLLDPKYAELELTEKIKLFREVLLEHGYNVSAIDDDMCKDMIRKIEGWLG